MQGRASPRGAGDVERALGRFDAVEQAGQPASLCRIGAACAIVADVDRQYAGVDLDLDVDVRAGGACVLDDVRQETARAGTAPRS
jgi:hypothetical protein